jgi:Peptidase family S41
MLGQAPAQASVSAAGLQADVRILRSAYEQMHPGLYRYNTPRQMAAAFDSLAADLNHDLALAEVYRRLSVFLGRIKCGHTYANFYNQSSAVAAALFRQSDRLPFYFRWLNRRMVVTRNFSTDARLVPGTEIVTIDGIPAGAILARLLPVSRADGHNEAKRISNLEVQGAGRYEAFDVYYSLFFPSSAPRRTVRAVVPGASDTLTSEVATLTDSQRVASAAVDPTDSSKVPWTFTWLDPHLAILRMPTWALYTSHWDWHRYLDSVFVALDGVPGSDLIVDLRQNEGGLDVGNVILSHLVTSDLRLPQYERRVRYRRAPTALRPYLDTWDTTFANLGADAVGPVGGFYRLDREAGSVLHAVAPHFAGRVYVLVGAANSSATFQFALIAKQRRLATLVGQSTGGNRRGINGGAFFFLRLPNSGLEVDLPLIGTFPTTPQPDAGVAPDVVVTPNIGDIARGDDAELAAAQQLAGRAQ